MPKTFTINAGPIARKHIQEKGLSPEDISVIPAAAGGPKWIALHAFDKYLMQDWFNDRQTPLHLVGASAGAWRMLCYLMPDPTEALDRFLAAYAGQTYEVMPTREELSRILEEMMAGVLGQSGVARLLEDKAKKLYVISSQTHFPKKENGNYKISFAKLILKNLVSRKWLQTDLERIVFTNSTRKDLLKEDGFLTKYLPFTEDNKLPALRSTGSIPLLMNPVEGIVPAPGLLWDGALIDYHMGLDYQTDGLIFYPHFTNKIIRGWFDKFLFWRKFRGAALDKMILISPSEDFVKSWPDSKIPDRKDFETYMKDNDRRIKNWYEVARRGKEMAEEFDSFWKAGKLPEIIQPF